MIELYIYPENASFDDRNFIFQLASATVDLEKSNFSDFTDYTRLIMTLDNELTLIHSDNDKKIILNKYEPYIFDGGIKTVSYGRVKDFNLIMNKDKCCGSSKVLSISKDSNIYPQKSIHSYKDNFEVIYCIDGQLTFNHNNEKHTIRQGDVLIIDHNNSSKNYHASNDNDEKCNIITSMIMCQE